MDQMVINAKTRTTMGKKAAKVLRATGRIPAIMYNSKGQSTMIDVDETEFNKVWRTVTPTTLVTLKIDGKDSAEAFIKDTEYNIRTDKVLHADFFEPASDKELTVKMKLQYTGTPAGVLKGGFMRKHTPFVTLKAVAKNIPERLVVDVSGINVGEHFCVKDLSFGKGVTVLTAPETYLVSVSPAR
ncbi:50S ribosomal protein L25 [Treponema parvum]|uniref:Large ribosomal subunit protein bL25 n=1 Tax=Treponema parvum TaxID=138851 RepID=A0A975IEW8_9SPIR|nr:50S ribosomal protein L25 [Treponema parvum]QTQ14323.1 50S ribosomal protein L25 [Treponema parvum]